MATISFGNPFADLGGRSELQQELAVDGLVAAVGDACCNLFGACGYRLCVEAPLGGLDVAIDLRTGDGDVVAAYVELN